MILVSHGAKKNVGDYLIHSRGRAILEQLLPGESLVSFPRWDPIPADLIGRARAVVLCGGPGLTRDFYPGTFRLVPNIHDVNVPVLPLALGWSGRPAQDPFSFNFDPPSHEALKAIHAGLGWSSVRDDLSLDIMKSCGVEQVRRSGCTAWYHLPSLGKRFVSPGQVRSLVFTTPASPRLFGQAFKLMKRLASRYPTIDRWCVFHRGIGHDKETRRRTAYANYMLARVASALKFTVVDGSSDLSKIDFYGDVDLHVGYRVHAHLAFLSQRRGSILVSEDGRGVGQALTFGDPYRLVASEPDLVDRVESAVDTEVGSWDATRRAIEEIERSWPVMRETVLQLRS